MDMLKSGDLHIARRLKRRLVEVTTIDWPVVYGSRARGDAVPESALDIYIEVPSLTSVLRQRISEIAWEISLDADVVISALDNIGSNPLAGQSMRLRIDVDGRNCTSVTFLTIPFHA